MEVTARELRDRDPKQFEKEYASWCEYALDYEWWGCIEEDFRKKMEPCGVDVERIEFSVGHAQSDYAAFAGVVNLAKFMQHMKLDEQYPVMYQSILDDGSYIRINNRWRGRWEFELREATYDVAPGGVFKDLDDATYQELVEDQWRQCDIEQVVRDFCVDVGHDLYRDLEKESDYLTSEEAFIESCECNDVKFEIEGDEE